VNGLERELLISTGMVVFRVLTHLIGLSLLLQLTRLHLLRFATSVRVDRILVPLGMVLAIFVIHGVEIWGYAILYWKTGATDRLEDALFLSMGAYATSGWPDVPIREGWRFVVSLESINGLLLVGWSTAFFFQNLTRLMVTEASHPLPQGAIAREPPKPRPHKQDG
jgi:voltage-gated potassium channel